MSARDGVLTRVLGEMASSPSAGLPGLGGAGLGRDLIEEARRGAFDALVSRPELETLLAFLLRKSRSSVAILGLPGVGKTALVETLAREVARGRCGVLAGARILELDLAGLVAGTSLRGSFEERARGLLAAAAKSPDLILFADEIHLLAGAGRSSQGSLDLGQILKPALARGEIRIVGATTEAEWRAAIGADPALARRFEELRLREPSLDETRAMVASQARSLEVHHGIAIGADAVEAAIEISERRIPDRRQPDKAANLLDIACARLRLAGGAVIDRAALEAACGSVAAPCVAPGDLEERLARDVFGQDEAVRTVSRAVRRGLLGLRERAGPIASVLVVGPEGCGKTHLARSLAAPVFGSAAAVCRFDEVELATPGAANRLVGAPPGYVRSDEEGLLFSALARSAGAAVVVFESIDVAEPEVLGLASRLLEEGRLTIGGGRVIDVSRSILVFTCRVEGTAGRVGFGAGAVERDPSGAVACSAEGARAQVPEDRLPASLLSRIDEVAVLRELEPAALRRILADRIGRVRDRLLARGVQTLFDREKLEIHLAARTGFPPRGGWGVERVLERELLPAIETALAKIGPGEPATLVLGPDYYEGGRVRVALSRAGARRREAHGR